MVQPEFRFLRRMVYDLKRKNPCSIGLYQTVVGQDYKTGVKSTTQNYVQIAKAVVLPDRILRRFNFVEERREFKYGGSYDSNTRNFLVSRRDIPSTFVVDMNMQVVYQHKKYSVKQIDEFEQAEAIIITGEQLIGSPTLEIFNLIVVDRINLIDSVVRS